MSGRDRCWVILAEGIFVPWSRVGWSGVFEGDGSGSVRLVEEFSGSVWWWVC